MVYTILDSATVLKSSKLALVQEADQITVELPSNTATGTDTYSTTIEGIETYTTHMIVGVLFTNANTGSSTLNINGLGAKTLKKSVSTNLAGGDIHAGAALLLYYDGTNFQVIGLGGSSGASNLSAVLTAGNDGGGLQIKNIANPTAAQDAATKAYADSLVTGLWDDRGNFDASVNAYPSSGGSGTAGAILKGDIWTVSVAGTLPTGQVVEIGDTVRALVDTPGNTQANWSIQQNNIGYTAENSANKTDSMTGNEASSTKYLSSKGVYDWVTGAFIGATLAALSVLGNPTNASANASAITASADHQILRRAGTAIGFGSIDLSQSGAVGTSILGSNNGGAGAVNGILKANGSGVVSAAVSGTDFLAPSAAWLAASGTTLTGNNEIVGTSRTFQMTWDSLGTTQTNGYGIWLRNTTAAANGAQQISPSLVLEGQGWRTNATAESQSVKWAIDLLPVQGTANPNASLRFSQSINNSAYTTNVTINSAGTTALPTLVVNGGSAASSTIFSVLRNGNQAFRIIGDSTVNFGSSATTFYPGQASGSTDASATGLWILTANNSQNGFGLGLRIASFTTVSGGHSFLYIANSTFAPTAGNATISALTINHTINTTGTYSGVGYGIDYNPTLTSTTGLTHYAFRHTSGFVAWQSILSPSQITSNQNDYNPTGWQNGGAPHGASIVRINTDASRNLTSLTGGVSGRLVIIQNVGSFDLVIKNDDGATGTAANRFALNADITIQPNEGLLFWYDATSSRWRACTI